MPPRGFTKAHGRPLNLTADEAAGDLISALRSEFTAEAERIAKEETKSCLALLRTLENSLSELQSISANLNKKKSSPTTNKKKTIGATLHTAKKDLKNDAGSKRKKTTPEAVIKDLSELDSETESPKKKKKANPPAAKPRANTKPQAQLVRKVQGRSSMPIANTSKAKSAGGGKASRQKPALEVVAKCGVCKEGNLRNNRMVMCHGSCGQSVHARKICGNVKSGEDDTWICESCVDGHDEVEMGEEADDEEEEEENEDMEDQSASGDAGPEDGKGDCALREQGGANPQDSARLAVNSDYINININNEKSSGEIIPNEYSPKTVAATGKEVAKESQRTATDSAMDSENSLDTHLTETMSDYELDVVQFKPEVAKYRTKSEVAHQTALFQGPVNLIEPHQRPSTTRSIKEACSIGQLLAVPADGMQGHERSQRCRTLSSSTDEGNVHGHWKSKINGSVSE